MIFTTKTPLSQNRVATGATLSLCSLMMVIPQAFAQEITLDEIVVTAQKRSENLQDVPIAITAFGKDHLDKIGAISLKNIEGASTSLSFGGGGSSTRGEIGIRGVSDYSRNIGNDARVGVYIDGVYQGRSYASDADLLGIERIEVLRGPQGTLFGRNTVAGAISMTMRKPADEFSGEVIGEFGNMNYYRIAGRFDLPLVTDKANMAVTLGHTKRDGFIRNIFNETDLNGINRTTGRATLSLTPSDAVDISLAGDFLTEDTLNQSNQALAGPGFDLAPDPYEVAFNAEGKETRDIWGLSGTINYTFGNDYTLTSITAYRHSEFAGVGIEEDYTPAPVAYSDFNEASKQLSQEIRVASPTDDDFDYVAGLYYLNQKLSTSRQAVTGIYFPLGAGVVQTPGEVEVRAYAAFINMNYAITENLELLGGLRLTHEKKELDYSINDTVGLFTNFTNFKDSSSYTDLSPRLGLNYHVNDDVMVYATASRAFKSGGWNADFITTTEQISFDPEQATNYELGLKSTWFDQVLRMNLSLFHTKYDDFQVSQFIPVSTGGTIITITNAGKVTTQGFEAEFTALPTDNLKLTANIGYTDAKFNQFKDGGGPGVDYDGNRLPYSSKWKTYFSAEYGWDLGSFGRMVAFADYSRTGDFFTNSQNDPLLQKVDAFGIVSARLSLTMLEEQLEVSLWAKNLFDKTYYRSRSRSFLGVSRGVVELPRTFGLRAKYKF